MAIFRNFNNIILIRDEEHLDTQDLLYKSTPLIKLEKAIKKGLRKGVIKKVINMSASPLVFNPHNKLTILQQQSEPVLNIEIVKGFDLEHLGIRQVLKRLKTHNVLMVYKQNRRHLKEMQKFLTLQGIKSVIICGGKEGKLDKKQSDFLET